MSNATENKQATSRLENGSRRFEQVTGVAAQAFIDSFASIAPDFGKYILEWEFADLYGRSGLDLRTRELIIIAACGALGPAGHGAVEMHIKAALRAGATRTEIVEVIMQLSFAAGLPIAIGAMDIASRVFSELDAADTDRS